jgi:hypothetical protein
VPPHSQLGNIYKCLADLRIRCRGRFVVSSIAVRKIIKAASECDEYHKFYFNQRNPNLMARRVNHCYFQLNKEWRTEMSALILLVAAVPATVALSTWSDVGRVQEEINQRKINARNLGMPGDYHTLFDETRRD